jgi:Protein export membrane protein
MNQTLARSINTSLVAILPVLAVLVIGAQLLGATTLQYFGLALVIGLTSGAYSSIFIASPVLSGLKEREVRYINIRRKLENKSEGIGLLTPRQAAVLTQAASPSTRSSSGGSSRPAPRRQTGVLRPGAATRSAAVLDDEEDGFEDDGAEDDARSAPKAKSGSNRSTGSNGARRAPTGAAARPSRPPPRPRKGKGAKKGGKRR